MIAAILSLPMIVAILWQYYHCLNLFKMLIKQSILGNLGKY